MNHQSNHRPRVGVPYRTRDEELARDHSKIEQYLGAVSLMGGEPVEISLGLSDGDLKGLMSTLDAVVLSGSPADIEPSRFQAIRHPQAAQPDPERERTDFALLEHSLAEQKPLLAICFGIQSLNVFLGGTLIQDIPTEIPLPIEHEWQDDLGAPETFHPAHIESGSRLAQIAGVTEIRVNSSHHQSVDKTGRGLRVVANAPDRVIEAVEWTNDANWVVGVQWHPERMVETDSLAQALFRSLIVAAHKKSLKA